MKTLRIRFFFVLFTLTIVLFSGFTLSVSSCSNPAQNLPDVAGNDAAVDIGNLSDVGSVIQDSSDDQWSIPPFDASGLPSETLPLQHVLEGHPDDRTVAQADVLQRGLTQAEITAITNIDWSSITPNQLFSMPEVLHALSLLDQSNLLVRLEKLDRGWEWSVGVAMAFSCNMETVTNVTSRIAGVAATLVRATPGGVAGFTVCSAFRWTAPGALICGVAALTAVSGNDIKNRITGAWYSVWDCMHCPEGDHYCSDQDPPCVPNDIYNCGSCGRACPPTGLYGYVCEGEQCCIRSGNYCAPTPCCSGSCTDGRICD